MTFQTLVRTQVSILFLGHYIGVNYEMGLILKPTAHLVNGVPSDNGDIFLQLNPWPGRGTAPAVSPACKAGDKIPTAPPTGTTQSGLKPIASIAAPVISNRKYLTLPNHENRLHSVPSPLLMTLQTTRKSSPVLNIGTRC